MNNRTLRAALAPAPDTMLYEDGAGALDRSLLSLVRVNWETIAWVLVFVVGAVARFVNLGTRAMSHDESLHALYSYYLYNAGNYEHNPMMHGPLLFHMNALVYFLFGDSDATARLVPALFGMGLLVMALLYRRYIGRLAALATGVLIAISPSLLFHSRYIRNDIYIALFTMVWIYAAFRYLDESRSQRFRWVMVMVLSMAFGFVTKENQFMHGAIIGMFFSGLVLWQVIQGRMFLAVAPSLLGGGIGFWLLEVGQLVPGVIVAGLGMLVTLVLLVIWLGKDGWLQVRQSQVADLAVVMVTLIMPFLAPFGHLVLGWDAMAYTTTTDMLRSAGLVLIMTGAAVGIAYYWFGLRPKGPSDDDTVYLTFGQWAQLMGVFWLIQVLFFTTFLTNTRNGLATGIVGSLGYWLAQQEVARGNQPVYYYAMVGWLYEFLPAILSLGGIASLFYWLRRDGDWDPVAQGDLPADLAVAEPTISQRLRTNRIYFVIMAVWWTVGMWLAYTVAGEKMPWLLTHIVLPMCVLGGWWFARLVKGVDWHAVRQGHGLWLLVIPAALVYLVVVLLVESPFSGRDVTAVGMTMQWIAALLALLGVVVGLWWIARRVGTAGTLRMVAIGVTGLLLLVTVRFSYMLNYVNYDLATEYLVYAHGAPDIKRALNEIDLISQRTVGERNIVVAYDDDTSWPLSWYMRLYPNSRFYGANPNADVMSSPVVIVGPKNYEKVRPYMARDYVKRTYRLVWWPDQGYFDMTPQRFWSTITDGPKMKKIFDILLYRRYPDAEDPTKVRELTDWPNRHEFEMYVRRDLASQVWNLNVTPLADQVDPQEELLRQRTIDLPAAATIGGQLGDLPLLTPRAVAVGPNGERVIADTGNHRIVVVGADGALLATFGSLCRLGEGEVGGCVDPDGDGPLVLGDGQFNEPWGVAVDSSGTIYVADTWNGRIQAFDMNGEFLRRWGYFNTTDGTLGDPLALFGPRGVAVDTDGNVLVADTGNKRILQFTPTGELLRQVGGGGVQLGMFAEPTDVAVDPGDGSIFVADAWNRRIQKLDGTLQALAEWPVSSWGSQHLYYKPFVTVAGNGDVYISDPENFRILVYNSAGGLKAAFGNFGAENNRFALPNGLAWDGSTNQLLVADADNQRVQVFTALP